MDVVRGINKGNPKFLDVSRVEVMEIADSEHKDEEKVDSESSDEETGKTFVTLRRCKVLTIQNYDLPWKGNDASD